jgi:hypothetical protein
VDPIDLSLVASNLAGPAGAATWQGGVTLLNVAGTTGPRSSYLRLLSLLGHELMGGQRSQVERTGRMSPLPEINEESNLILRKGAVDEFGSAVEMPMRLCGRWKRASAQHRVDPLRVPVNTCQRKPRGVVRSGRLIVRRRQVNRL